MAEAAGVAQSGPADLSALWRIDGHEWRISLVRAQMLSYRIGRGYFTVPSTRQKAVARIARRAEDT